MGEKKIKNCSHCKYYKWDMQFDEDICTKQNIELKISSSDDYCCENWIFHDPEYYYKQLQLKDNELKQLNQARDEICASGHPDYIGIIRDKNIELQLKDKMIGKMADKMDGFNFLNSPNIIKYFEQQALAELEE